MFCSHDVCVARPHLRLANLELVVHVGVKSVVSSSQSEQNDLLWSVQFVKAVRLVIVWVLLLSGTDNNNNNERISRALFHVKHAQLR